MPPSQLINIMQSAHKGQIVYTQLHPKMEAGCISFQVVCIDRWSVLTGGLSHSVCTVYLLMCMRNCIKCLHTHLHTTATYIRIYINNIFIG